jgi:hypothetical protein
MGMALATIMGVTVTVFCTRLTRLDADSLKSRASHTALFFVTVNG